MPTSIVVICEVVVLWCSAVLFCADKHVIDELSEMRMRITDFNVVKVIGRGAFGEVQLVRNRNTRQVYALKLLNKDDMVGPCTFLLTVR